MLGFIQVRKDRNGISLKFVPATFLLVCSVCLKYSPFETRKIVFCFTLKTLFVSGIIQILTFQIFKYNDTIKWPSIKLETHFTK